MKNLLFCSILLLAFGCNSLKEKKDADGGNNLKDESYSVTSITGTDISSENLTLVISEGGQKVSGFCGCNTYFGVINPQGSDALFTRLSTTKMLCNNNMTTERLFLKEIKNVTAVSIEGNSMNLLNATGETIIIVSKK